jgi:hypothetical protein
VPVSPRATAYGEPNSNTFIVFILGAGATSVASIVKVGPPMGALNEGQMVLVDEGRPVRTD